MSIKRKLRAERDEARDERDRLWVWLDSLLEGAEEVQRQEAIRARDELKARVERSIESKTVFWDERPVWK